MDRHIRKLSHQKGSKITIQTNIPLNSDGDDGDQIMVGSTLYIKGQGRWMPFRPGVGNINDGWHGSQRYVKILPTDFMIDDDSIYNDTGPASAGTAHTHGTVDDADTSDYATYNGSYVHSSPALLHNDASTTAKTNVPSGVQFANSTYSNGVVHPTAKTGSNRGCGAFLSIPLGYWAIAVKIYCSYTWKYGWNSNIPQYCDNFIGGLTGNYGSTAVYASGGIQAHNCSIVTGGSSTLLAGLGSTNVKEVFDTAMLGAEDNYCYVAVNGIPTANIIYGGYIELRRVKTAEALSEEESEAGGGSLPRARGG